jgi:hypothetical protein
MHLNLTQRLSTWWLIASNSMLHERTMQRIPKILRATKLGVSRAVGQDPSLGELTVGLRVQPR